MESFALQHSLSTAASTLSSRSSLIRRCHPISKSTLLLPQFTSFPALSASTLEPPSSLFSHHYPLSIKTRKSNSSIRASSSPVPEPTPQSPPPKSIIHGAKPLPLIISVAIGLVLRFLIPKPVEVTAQAWQLLSIFLSTIAGLILSPLPVGAWAFLGLTTSIVTKTLAFSTAFNAFTNEVSELMIRELACSFFFKYDLSL